MINLTLNIGIASKYLITDTGKMLAAIENPYCILSNHMCGLKECADGLATIYNHAKPSGLFQIKKGNLDPIQLEKFLNELLINAEGPKIKYSMPMMTFEKPVLVISHGIEKQALNTMKVLKIRGLCQLVAIDVSSAEANETTFKLGMELSAEEISAKPAFQVYKPPKRLGVVSGVNKSVISTESKPNQILRNYPDIATKYDPAIIKDEPLL